MKSSSLADPMMRGCLCQCHATATEISILVEQQPSERIAHISANELLSGGEDGLFRINTSVDKYENAESLKHFYHGAVHSIQQSCFSPLFPLQTASPNCFLCLGEMY